MAQQVWALLASSIRPSTHVNKGRVKGVVHLEVLVGIEHSSRILQ